MLYESLIVLAATLWGLDGIWRRNLSGLPPIVTVFWEHALGLLVLVIGMRIWRQKLTPPKKMYSRTRRALIVVALLSGVIGTLAFTTALAKTQYIPLSVVFFLQKLQPIFTIITALFILREQPRKSFWIWAAVALVAGFFMTFPEGRVHLEASSAYTIAAGLALLAAIAWGTSTIFSKIALQDQSFVTVTFWRFALTSLFAFIADFLLGQGSAILHLATPQWINILAIVCSTGMFALLLYYKGLQKVPAHISCILELAFPLTGLLLDWFLYHTLLQWHQLLAAAILVFASYRIIRLSQVK